MYDMIILGGGPAGLTAALYGGRAAYKVLLLEPGAFGGKIASAAWVDNYPGFHKGIEGAELGQLLAQHAERFGVEAKKLKVEKIDLAGSVKKVIASGKEYLAKIVIIATGTPGTLPRALGAEGEEEFMGRGVSYCATCDAPFFKNKDVVVIGGGDEAMREALHLSRFARKVTIVHRQKQFQAAPKLLQKAEAEPKIEFMLETAVKKFEGQQLLEKVMIEDLKTKRQQELEAQGAFISVGRLPDTEFLEGLEKDEKGYIITNENMETSIPGVFAAGDVRRKSLRQVVTAAADGAIAATMAIKYLEKL